MSVRQNCYWIIVLSLLFFSTGCGNGNSTVTGKVTFPDGAPMTTGDVLFESSSLMAKGAIQKDGTYSLNAGDMRGVPKGTYRVSIGGFKPRVISAPPPALPAGGGPPKGPIRVGPPQIIAPVIPVDKKFLSPVTSGLTCEVKGRTTYNIEVTPPSEAEAKKK